MAVQLHSSFILPEKFEKLKFQDFSSVDTCSTPSTPSTPCSPPTDPYEVEIIQKDDEQAVLEFLRTFFFRDEPLNNSLGLLEGRETCPELEKFSLKDFDDGLSLKAVSNGKIIGLSLNGLLERGFLDKMEPPQCPDEKFLKILTLLDHVARESDVFAHFPDVDKAITVKIISVNSAWRGRGIAKDLMDRTRDLAKKLGCQLMTVDCTSHFTAKALKRLGFECIYSQNYEDFTINGKRVLFPDPPHKACTVYVQKII